MYYSDAEKYVFIYDSNLLLRTHTKKTGLVRKNYFTLIYWLNKANKDNSLGHYPIG